VGLAALLAASKKGTRVVLVGTGVEELAEVATKAGAEVIRAGRGETNELRIGETRSEDGNTIVSITGKYSTQVRLGTQNPAVDRCLAAVAGVIAGGGDAERSSFALGVLSVAAASAERLQLEQVSGGQGSQVSMVTPEQLEAAAAPAPGPELDDELRAELGRF